MLRDCAPGFEAKVTKHSVMIHYGGKSGVLPKGPGIPKRADVTALRGVGVEEARVRKLTTNLGLSVSCVNAHFPDLFREA